MRKFATITFCILLIGCQNKEAQDQLKFSNFDQVCRDQASEFVTEGAANGSVTLTNNRDASKFGPGTADRPVYDQEYNPEMLLETLMLEPNKLSEVRYRYMVHPSTVSPHAKQCWGYYYIDVKSSENVKTHYPCEQAKKWNPETDHVRYAITYEYGVADENEVRPFTFRLVDSLTGRVIAEQKSFQLLLGGMASKKNRSFTYLGFAQRVKNCKLTPPDLLIKKAFRKNA